MPQRQMIAELTEDKGIFSYRVLLDRFLMIISPVYFTGTKKITIPLPKHIKVTMEWEENYEGTSHVNKKGQ